MSRSDFTAFTPATAPTQATAATASNMSATRPVLPAAFSTSFAAGTGAASAAGNAPDSARLNATFRQVHDEVARYIASAGTAGAGGASAGSALTADGAALRARIAARAIGGSDRDNSVPDAAQQAFLEAIRPHAEAAAARLGVAPELVAAHAALESGWGRHAPGNNMFGIKAGGSWQGAVQALATVEVDAGVAHNRNEQFRGYGDMAGSFEDYAGMLLDNPRYRRALNTGSDAQAFAHALQAGGYATDPAYADKLGRVAASIKAVQQAQQSQRQ
ncbi:flagellar assembly peptidoglycan hydrolase FlgJ [Pseudoduganella eburnea]|uniref:Flagellar assembly peptidoglycan hydrolase FlgJ n=2 Tax=Massilia eburnea TaxID=1776165 RepID=A0A6L6QII2_9BURK|nr:flagellar assembly peptidoglycan hydrolase FlgJ [Massilia eburnea]